MRRSDEVERVRSDPSRESFVEENSHNLDGNEDLNKDETSQIDFNEDKETKELSINEEKNQSPKRPAKRSSMKRPRKEQDRADVAFNELLAIKEKIVTRNSSCVSRDECTVYGELLAIKLRRLDGRTQRLAMHKIDIMFDLTFDSSMLPSPRSSSSHSSHIITTPLPSPGSSCAQYSPQSQPVIAIPLPSPGSSCEVFMNSRTVAT
ncbi:unnamed protein product [Psylliodes chrysocephalus]|uniref:Uncharacterized protein n=1 Tax=Psylliodes chrysocephalus TaxID=3402493 RepID=A0A9P0GBA3_9CUCU|nr:unnamed protein product [Psylliodes chrysocephala]